MPEAEDLLKRLLARRKATRVIEQMAVEARSPVTQELAIKGFITASAKITCFRLVAPLRAEGINPADYQAELDEE